MSRQQRLSLSLSPDESKNWKKKEGKNEQAARESAPAGFGIRLAISRTHVPLSYVVLYVERRGTRPVSRKRRQAVGARDDELRLAAGVIRKAVRSVPVCMCVYARACCGSARHAVKIVCHVDSRFSALRASMEDE